MKKMKFVAVLGMVVMMAIVAVLSVGTKVESNACFKRKEVKVYVPNENADGFNVAISKMYKVNAKNVVKALKKQGALSSNVALLGFEDNGDSLVLNLSQSYADDVNTAGTSGECMKVGSVVNTFLQAFEASSITILVEGNTWESGHAVYDEPLSMFPIGNETQDDEDANEEDTNVEVNIYVGNENADGFIANPMLVAEVTPENLMNELEIVQAVASDVRILGFEDNGDSLVLNLSQEFANDVNTSGTAGEYIKIGVIVNTFLDAYDANEITIQVEGAEWETGHNVYDYPMTKFN